MQTPGFFHLAREYLFQGSSDRFPDHFNMSVRGPGPESPAFYLFFFHLQWVKTKNII